MLRVSLLNSTLLVSIPSRASELIRRRTSVSIQESRRSGLEPVGGEFARIEQQQAGDIGRIEGIQDRLVVLVDQHHDPPPRLPMQSLQQRREAAGRRRVVAGHPRTPFRSAELLHDVRFQAARRREMTTAEVQTHHRMTN